jgi:hypothetical protein
VPDKGQYSTATVSFPGGAAMFKDVSASEITMVPSMANQERRDRDALGRYKAQEQRGVSRALETDAGEIREVSPRLGRLLTPPFGLFLRAALLVHLERTFR